MENKLKRILDNTQILEHSLTVNNYEQREFANAINSIVDHFLFLNSFAKETTSYYSRLELMISNLLVTIIDLYNRKEAEDLSYYTKLLLNNLYEWLELVKSNIKFTVVIYGVNYMTQKITEVLESSNCKVIAYLDNSLDYNVKLLLNRQIISKELIKEIEFDFLFIIEEIQSVDSISKNMGIQQEKIIDYYTYFKQYLKLYNELFSKRYLYSMLYSHMKKAKECHDYEVIVTGLSYTQQGIDREYLSKKAVKVCSSSQDLYFDYAILKEILQYNTNFKYCIMGLSYYSFDYDVSLSKSQGNLIKDVYYPLLKDSHHYDIQDTYTLPIGIESIGELLPAPELFTDKRILETFINRYNCNLVPEHNENLWNSPTEDIPLEWLAKSRAEAHNRLNYSKTRKENEGILKAILQILKKNEVTPIIVIFPTLSVYSSNYKESRKSEFYEIISRLKNEHDFQLIDMFSSSHFNEKDFADGDHLNKSGAKKMTKYLEQHINW